MSILTEILLFCDGGVECPELGPFNQDDAKDANLVSASKIRTNALTAGWVKVGRKDFCQACASRLGYRQSERGKDHEQA
ncbi:hypothetical protein [Pandoraea communis]|uniref:hypothetical protein n=1 Tax=Pandoraea communis TaxID=2508297 RepID=UPI0025A5E5A8|nr:hypothetical protein [Pandoraea communis]MDM8356571.1 hypothetical protein [Pandoraea communis]